MKIVSKEVLCHCGTRREQTYQRNNIEFDKVIGSGIRPLLFTFSYTQKFFPLLCTWEELCWLENLLPITQSHLLLETDCENVFKGQFAHFEDLMHNSFILIATQEKWVRLYIVVSFSRFSVKMCWKLLYLVAFTRYFHCKSHYCNQRIINQLITKSNFNRMQYFCLI